MSKKETVGVCDYFLGGATECISELWSKHGQKLFMTHAGNYLLVCEGWWAVNHEPGDHLKNLLAAVAHLPGNLEIKISYTPPQKKN